MNSDTLRERQRMLQAERQRSYRERKRQIEKENTAPSKRTKEITDEIIELSSVPKARVYPWISLELRRHTLGNMTYKCSKCGAMMWLDERINKSTRLPEFSTCCAKGKVILPSLQELPPPLNTLLTETDPRSCTFRKNIRMYNSALSFTSIGAKIDQHITGTSGIYTFRIHGEMYHRIGPLLPDSEAQPQFAQIYIYDTDHEIQNRSNIISGLDPSILAELQQMLHDINPYVNKFRQAGNLLKHNPSLDLKLIITNNRTKDSRRYNTPNASEVAAIMIGDGQEMEYQNRDIILQPHEGGLQQISEIHRAYTPLHYVLMFPRGEDGWHPNIPIYNEEALEISDNDEANVSNKYVTAMNYFAYRLQVGRSNETTTLHYYGRLFQQWIVDMYTVVEQTRLNYLRFNQKQIRAELYNGLQDAMISGDSTTNIGQRIILPSSFTGGPRQMHQLYQDGMAIVRVFGKPDLFITITCNPNWPEIKNALLPGQTAQDRPELISRVFNMKLKAILNDILKENIFGKVLAYLYTIEFQKRGLPHAHLLLILAQSYKPKTPADYDTIVSAEIPDENSNPNTFNTVKQSMMHGPCGILNPNAPCMKDGKCSKKYPRNFQENTTENEDGYPIYRRRNNNRTVKVKGIDLDNRWVVPYNPYLTTKYNCHINVEICSSITAVKYLFKYVYKGHDRATIGISSDIQAVDDEIKFYLDARYISASEASWRIFHYRLHNEKPDVIQLCIHLPGQHRVLFRDDEQLEDIIERSTVEKSTLTAWFHANTIYPHARRSTYADFPIQWVYNNQTKNWKPRQRGDSIGRMYFVHPAAGEQYYLRMLLNIVCGATSFENLRTVDGILYPSFKEACIALGLLQNDEEWDQCLREAEQIQTGMQLRKLFAILLLFCEVTRPEVLWESHISTLSDDILFQVRQDTGNMTLELTDNIRNKALYHLQSILSRYGRNLGEFPNMPIPTTPPNNEQNINRLIREEQQYNIEELAKSTENNYFRLNIDQQAAFKEIIAAVETETSVTFFVDGPGGTGKTFLYK
jgi:hypothetical protein